MALANQLAERFMEWTVAVLPATNQLSAWAFFAGMLVLAVVSSQLIALVFKWLVQAATTRTQTRVDDIVLERVQQPLAWIVFSLLLWIAVAPLPLSAEAMRLLDAALVALNIVVAAWLVHRFADAVFTVWQETFARRTATALDDTMLPILSKFTKAAVWVVAGLVVLGEWGVAIGPFLAGLGIAGIAIGFAVKDSLANIFGGISLALDHAYRIGDKVKLADDTVGVVYDISLRSTRIRTYDGDLVMVPNGKIANDNIYTYAQPAPKSRGQVEFGVEYGSDAQAVKDAVAAVLRDIEQVAEDPAPSVHFVQMGESALEFRAYFWLDDYNDVWSTEREATQKIYERLRESGIGIPFPTRTVYLKKE